MLEAAQLSWLSTVRADGRPHVIPVVSVWRDGALHFSTADIEQKAVNLRGNLWQKGLDVVVEGDAIRITDQDMFERLASYGRPGGTDDSTT